MPLKPDAAAPASGAELLARYRATRARLMAPPSPAKPAPAAVIDEDDETLPAWAPPAPGPKGWRAELIEFNELLRRLFVGHAESAQALVAHQIRDLVAMHFGITVAEIVGQRTTRKCAWPRQIAMYICARQTGLSLPRIGRIFGRDHSTVIHAVRLVGARMAADPALAAEISTLIETCRRGGPA
jgi:Bacterial dnaA protein helix-turn-helix